MADITLSSSQHRTGAALASCVPGENQDLLFSFPRWPLSYNTGWECSGKSKCFVTLGSSSAGRSWGCFVVMLFGNFITLLKTKK